VCVCVSMCVREREKECVRVSLCVCLQKVSEVCESVCMRVYKTCVCECVY